MLKGARILLRPVRDEDWPIIEAWTHEREALWGPYQRFQLDHLSLLQAAYQKSGLLSRESAFLLIETLEDPRVIGFVRYTFSPFPDADFPHPDIGFGIPDRGARGQGFASEATRLLVDYLFSSYPAERMTALTDTENVPAQRVLESAGFQREGVWRRATFRDGRWCDLALYGRLRSHDGYAPK